MLEGQYSPVAVSLEIFPEGCGKAREGLVRGLALSERLGDVEIDLEREDGGGYCFLLRLREGLSIGGHEGRNGVLIGRLGLGQARLPNVVDGPPACLIEPMLRKDTGTLLRVVGFGEKHRKTGVGGDIDLGHFDSIGQDAYRVYGVAEREREREAMQSERRRVERVKEEGPGPHEFL